MRNFTRCAMALFTLLFTVIKTQAQTPAFPGAEGAGMFTTGGRGTASVPTTVFEVTNLNDDNNPGSLRYALAATATYRTVVFRVSGTIHLNSKLSIKANTTIAGQTAPGDGICIADHPVVIGGDNVIVRHIRFRLGDKNQKKTDAQGNPVDGSGGDDAFGALGPNNIIIDHCSISWSADEALTIYRGDNLTIQWCFITEPLNYSYHWETGDTDYEHHGYGGIQGGKRATIHHNLYADCRNRNPRFPGISSYTPATVGIENVDYRNNVLYNWGINTVYGGEGGNYNVMNNYYKWGPNTGSGVKYRICNPSRSDAIDYGKWHVNGNFVDGSSQNTNNNWSGVTMQTTTNDTTLVKVLTPFDLGYAVTTQAATDAYEAVLQGAGATLPRRDTLDQRIVNDVRNRTGRIIDVQGGYPHGTAYNLTVNAWPALNSTTAPVDTDHDGMPDSWEQSHNLNPNDAADRNTYDGSGYTMLENYLNGVGSANPPPSTPPTGTNAVVAKDGSGQYTSIQAAINAAPTGRTAPWKIYIRKGKYVETVNIPGNKPFIQLVGESLAETIISYDNYSGKANPAGGTYGTSTCGTVIINAPDVMFMNLSIENATGYGINANAAVPAPGDGPQAVAVYTTSDRVVFYNVRMNGGQDTYYGGNVKGTRCYFKNCYVDGNTDFLFGSSTIIFDTCIIYPRTRLDNATGGFVTAVNTKAESGYGYVFRDCRITRNRGYTLYTLGRPWQNDAGTADASKSRNKAVFLNTIMGSTVKPEGWSAWDAGTNTSYITYGEYNSRNYNGTPVNVSGRLSWSKQLTAAEAVKYYNNDTVFVNANTPAMPTWNPYATWPELSAAFIPELSVSNLIAKKGASTSTITWNMSWPMSGITCELYRSSDKTNFSLISTQVSTEDSACNFSFAENIPPPGQTYYYIVRASKNGYAGITSDTASVVSKPTITVSGSMGSFLQGLGTTSASQTFLVSGANLIDNITITPPAGYEVSADNVNWYNSSSPLIVTQTGGVVANTYISVRLNGTSVGTYSGDIVNASASAASVSVAISGTIQADPLGAGALLLEQWPLITNNQDSAAVRAAGVVGTTPVLNNLVLSDGTTVPGVPAYSALHGQGYAATADGYWTTAKGGPGGTLNRSIYQQFTVVAAATHTLRVDSIILNTSFYNTSSNTKIAVLYSKTGFRTDSTEIKVATKNGISLTPGTSGTFTSAFDVSNLTAGNSDVFGMQLNGSAGITINAGDTLSFRIYHCTGTTSAGRYVKLKNVMVKGAATKNPVAGDFRSVKSGEWSDTATWQKYDGSNWVAATSLTDYPAYDGGVNTATVQDGHTVSYTQSFSKGFGYIQKTVIASGGQLIVGAGNSLKVAGINGSTVVLQIDGTLTNLGTIGTNGKVVYQVNGKMVNSGTLNFNTGDSVAVGAAGTYQHDMNGGLPARISFASGSTLLVTGIKTAQTNLFASATTVSNMVWNCTSQQNYFALRNTLAAVTGNLTVQSTGSTYVALSQGTAALHIGGNYTQTGGSIYFNESASGVIDSMVVAGDFIVSGGTFGSNMKNSDPLYIKLNGSNKTFSHLGTLKNTHILVNGYYNLGSHITLPTAGFGLVVNGTLNAGAYVVSGSGATTVADGAIVSFGAATGIDGNFANSGTKQYSTIANYTFNGTATQTTGATMPAGVHTLTINNSNNVTLSTSLTAGILNLMAGKLLLGDNTLTDTTIIGNMPAGYIVTSGTGKLKQAVDATSGNVFFPVGASVSSYTPVTLSNTGTADNFSVRVSDNFDYTINDTTKVVKKQWTITPDNASGTANVGITLGWTTADQGSAFNLAAANVLNYQNNTWAGVTAATSGSGTSGAPYTATATNFSQFGVFAVGVISEPVLVTTGALNAFSQTTGTPSAEQTYTVSGSDLSGNIIITPPAGYEISINGTTWYNDASPLTLAPANGVVAGTTIRVRLNATTAGPHAGNITHESAGAITQNVMVTGSAVGTAPFIAAGGVLNSFSQTVGKPTDAQTFKLSVTNISGAVTITPPAGYEMSVDTGKTWYTPAQVPAVTAATGSTLSASVMIRLNASAAGTYDGNIVIRTSGAPDLNVMVTGIAYGVYTINPNPAGSYVNIFHAKLYTPAHIRIYNVGGRLMGTWRTKPATNYTTVNISSLPNGMYFVEVERLNEKVLLRFIKQ